MDFKRQKEVERCYDIKSILKTVSVKLVVPIFLLVGIMDFFIYPDDAIKIFLVRLTVIPATYLVFLGTKKIHSYAKIQKLTLAYITFLSLNILSHLVITQKNPLVYCMGFILLGFGAISFVPFSRKFALSSLFVTFVPFLFLLPFIDGFNFVQLGMALTYIIPTCALCVFINKYNEKNRDDELKTRIELNQEVINRENVISIKTEANVNLTNLSRQFSPQVVESIKSSNLEFNTRIHNSHIASIFIDIVNSTKIITNLKNDRVDELISTFMNDASKILLKHDLTIDKFLGDGILAFCNDPIKHDDYLERTLMAAAELIAFFDYKKNFYHSLAESEIKIRIGIATGDATVGFFGSDHFFHSYTAIGPVVNKASRLVNIAQPGQIVLTNSAAQILSGNKKFELESLGSKSIRGIGNETVYCLKVADDIHVLDSTQQECPECQSILFVDYSQKEVEILKCRSCGHVSVINFNDLGGAAS